MVAPFAPKIIEVNDIQEGKRGDDDNIICGTIAINFFELYPHGKFIESEAKG